MRGSLLQAVNPASDLLNIPSSTQSGQSQLTFLRNGSQELPVQRQRKRDPVASLSKWFKKTFEKGTEKARCFVFTRMQRDGHAGTLCS